MRRLADASMQSGTGSIPSYIHYNCTQTRFHTSRLHSQTQIPRTRKVMYWKSNNLLSFLREQTFSIYCDIPFPLDCHNEFRTRLNYSCFIPKAKIRKYGHWKLLYNFSGIARARAFLFFHIRSRRAFLKIFILHEGDGAWKKREEGKRRCCRS